MSVLEVTLEQLEQPNADTITITSDIKNLGEPGSKQDGFVSKITGRIVCGEIKLWSSRKSNINPGYPHTYLTRRQGDLTRGLDKQHTYI